MKQSILIYFVSLALMSMNAVSSNAQQRLTLEDIWGSSDLHAKGTPGFNFMSDGRHYTLLSESRILRYDLVTGEQAGVLFDAGDFEEIESFSKYYFSPDENLLLIASNAKKIYRHSFEAEYFLYDRVSGSLLRILDGSLMRDPLFSPDGSRLAFCSQNDLYYLQVSTGEVTRVTHDGQWNHVINGTTDWVYEEEFAVTRMFDWSRDGRYLAWVRFDESVVPEFIMPVYSDDVYPEYKSFKYPKVGEANSTVSLHSYDTHTQLRKDHRVEGLEEYVPRIAFTKDDDDLCVTLLNRHQNHLQLVLLDVEDGDQELLLEERSEQYVDVHDDLLFTEDERYFVWTSDRDGYNHVYLYEMEGGRYRQLTSGEYDVTAFYGLDEKRNRIYFQAAMKSPTERGIYYLDLKGGVRPVAIANDAGWNEADFSTNFDYFVLEHSRSGVPPVYTVHDDNGRPVRVVEDNRDLKKKVEDLQLPDLEFMTVNNREWDQLNAYVIKPPDFDPVKKYPVFMFLYGGPGSQQVKDQWGGRYYWWFQMLAQQGYIVACVDNRGTGGRGAEFKKQTYMKLGELETRDQIDAARYFASLDYVDSARIGIFGWSYGGYMSTNCLLHGNDVFKMAIAVAPVTNWKWYDNIYTERYMRTVAENPDGYKAFSPVYFADRLEGKYLLIHGTSDDNVHMQNSVEMSRALIQAGKSFESMYYPNRDHAIVGGGVRMHLFKLMTDFIHRNL